MLVLSRKVGERIYVGDNIVLEIRRIAGNRVTLALDAPRHVRILRGELEAAAREFITPPAEHRTSPRQQMPPRISGFSTLPAQPPARECVT